MFKPKSIIFSARFVGVIAAILLIIATILSIQLSIFLDKKNEVHRAVMLYDLLFMQKPNKADFLKYTKKHKLTQISGEEIIDLRKNGKYYIEDELFRKTLQSGDIEIFIYKDQYYYVYKMNAMYYYRSDESVTPYKLYIISIFFIVLILLFILFRFISSSVNPLRELYIQIVRFANGEKDIHIEVQGNDEVAQVANAFVHSVKKNNNLQKSRVLFLRNVMHELKTPITSGKILVHFLKDDNKDKILFENLFDQMQIHLDDLARIESLTEKNMQLNIKIYSIIDIIDDAIDRLQINKEDLSVNITNNAIEVDFNIFAYAIKNLLSNALKYSNTKPIYLNFKDNTLTISNDGKPLEKEISHYLNAYERDLSQHSLEGMGLGLYIANEIIKRHNLTLNYSYENKMHNFSVCF